QQPTNNTKQLANKSTNISKDESIRLIDNQSPDGSPFFCAQRLRPSSVVTLAAPCPTGSAHPSVTA
ncbi:hypothetical protein CF319_g8582, partial [Tilletia indica]